MSLPAVILANVFQYVTEKDLSAAAKVSKKWARALKDEGYWGMLCERDMGTKPLNGVRNRAFYRSFTRGGGGVEWLVWYDNMSDSWVLNEELLAVLRGMGSGGSMGTAVVSVCPASTKPETAHNARKLLSSMMRSADAFTGPACATPLHTKGIQMWSVPAVFEDGTHCLYLLPQGIGSNKDSDDTDDATQQLQLLMYCLSTTVFVLDDEGTSGVKWWDALCPSLATPRCPTDHLVPTKGNKLFVVSSSDLPIPNHTSVPPEDRERVACWLAHFDELCMLNTELTDSMWHAKLASDCLQIFSQQFGTKLPVYYPGQLWPALSTAKLSLGQFADVVQCVSDRLNDQPHALFNDEFETILSKALFEKLVDDVTAFYSEAMAIELESGPMQAAELAHHGQAAEAPAEAPAPLWSKQLIEAHEQHLFASCRKLIFRMGEACMDGGTTFRFFEMLKNRISDEFRKVWGVNQGRSKAFCEATFDHVFEGVVAKYAPREAVVPPMESPTASSSSHGSGGSGFEVKKVKEFEKRKEKSKEDVRNLKRFYQSTVDHLDEYMMKAVGTRRGDVMLGKTKDLLERIEGSKAHNLRSEDLELAINEICAEVTSRVVKETADMEKTRNTMQKTCALYTKLLGMQCRQRVSALCRDKWIEEQTEVLNRHYAKVQLYCAVMGDEAAGETETAEQRVEDLIDSFTEAEKTAASDIVKFINVLPNTEKESAYKFGIVTDANPIASGFMRARAKGANILHKVKKKLVKL